jgi:hypothetical protein
VINKYLKLESIFSYSSAFLVSLLFSQLLRASEEIATVVSMEAGDIACYVELKVGHQYQQKMANFEICEQTHFIGKQVTLSYERGNVLSASCNGDMVCNKSDTVWLINKMTEAPPKRQGNPAQIESHCFQNEAIIFSCNTNSNKVISICSSSVLGVNHGYMQYRFGSIGSFPEFVYPMNHNRASNFFYSGSLTYSGGGGAYLKFINSTYSYVVYTGIGRGWNKQGLVINEGVHEIARYSCNGAWASNMGPQLFKQAGLQPDPYGFEIPVEYDE